MTGARDIVCAVDVGTSAVRAALVDAEGTVHASTRISLDSGSIDLDMDAVWRGVVAALLRFPVDLRARVVVVAFAAHVGTVLLDTGGDVVVARGWSDPAGVSRLADLFEPTHLHLAGRPAATASAAALLLKMAREDPAGFDRVHHVLSPKDYLVWRACGVTATDATSAAYTLLSDVRVSQWSRQLVDRIGASASILPSQLDATRVVGELTAGVSREMGLPTGTAVVGGGPDGTVGALALIGLRRDMIADIAGTTDVLVGLVDDPPMAGRVVVNPYVVADTWTVGGPTGLTGGAVLGWSRLLGSGAPSESRVDLETSLAQVPPGANGLLVNPFLTGSRFPDWRSAERGALHGLGQHHTALDVLRAVHEAVGFVVRTAVEAIAPALSSLPDVRVALGGGTSRSPTLVQLRADILGRSVLFSVDPDVTLAGAAMLGAVGARLHSGVAEAYAAMRPPLQSVDPQPGASSRYAELYDNWLRSRASG